MQLFKEFFNDRNKFTPIKSIKDKTLNDQSYKAVKDPINQIKGRLLRLVVRSAKFNNDQLKEMIKIGDELNDIMKRIDALK